MKIFIGLAAAFALVAVTAMTPSFAQGGATTAETGSNATGVQPTSKMSGAADKMSGSKMKAKKSKKK